MDAVNERRPEIKTLVIDTIGSIMVADEMRRMKEKGYDKWQDLAQCIWDIVDSALMYRPDLTVILIAKCVGGKYIFETHAKNSTAKSPMGLFESDEIPNDITEVIKALNNYENEE